VGRNPGDAFDFWEAMGLEGTKTIGNYWPFATTLFDYIRRAMPFDRPGTLADEAVYGITAWLLWKNEIISRNARMDASSLPAVVMPSRDRFVPDDRMGSTSVR
jgi:cytochrome c